MSDTPEPLAAILADYRKDIAYGLLFEPTREYISRLLDRVESAAKRERALLDANVNRVRELEAMLDGAANTVLGCAIKQKKSAPGNALKIREALEWVDRFFSYDGSGTSTDAATLAIEASTKTREALAAPVRNCDRFATADEAEREYCKKAFFAGYEDPVISAAFRWAFAPAKEGGAE